MLFFTRALHLQWIAEDNVCRYSRPNLSKVFELTANSPDIGFQGNRYNRYLSELCEFNPQRIKLFGIKIDAARRLRENDDGYIGV